MVNLFNSKNKLWFYAAVFLIFICSCNRMVVKNAMVDIIKPPNIYGHNSAMDEGLHHDVSVEFNAGGNNNNVIMPITEKLNTGRFPYPEQNVSYHMTSDIFGLQYSNNYKTGGLIYFGGNVGYQGFPYVVANMGINNRHFETGLAVLFGSVRQKIKYDGYYMDESDKITGHFDSTIYNCDVHSGAYFYTSVFFKRFALNYVISASTPLNDNIEENSCGAFSLFSETMFSADFPALIMQDIGIAYTNNHIKYRIGLNNITGNRIRKSYYGGSFQIALLF